MLRTLSALLLAGCLVALTPSADAQTTTTTSSTSTTIIIGGGGGARSDCLLVLGTAPNTPTNNPRHIRCADGDPCDADGLVNGDPKFDPEFQAFQNVLNTIDVDGDTADDCTTVIDFRVFIQGPLANNACRRDKKVL